MLLENIRSVKLDYLCAAHAKKFVPILDESRLQPKDAEYRRAMIRTTLADAAGNEREYLREVLKELVVKGRTDRMLPDDLESEEALIRRIQQLADFQVDILARANPSEKVSIR